MDRRGQNPTTYRRISAAFIILPLMNDFVNDLCNISHIIAILTPQYSKKVIFAHIPSRKFTVIYKNEQKRYCFFV